MFRCNVFNLLGQHHKMQSIREIKAFQMKRYTKLHANDALTPNKTTLTIQTKPLLVKLERIPWLKLPIEFSIKL